MGNKETTPRRLFTNETEQSDPPSGRSIQTVGLTPEHFMALRAVVLWHQTMENMTHKNKDMDYSKLIAKAFIISEKNKITSFKDEILVKQVIYDFYRYFYIKQHIADINYGKYDLLTNDYVNVAEILANSNYNEENMLYNVTAYVFKLIVSMRETLQLPVFRKKKKDKYLVKHFMRYCDRNNSIDNER